MDRATVNALLAGMVQSAEQVSDLIFIHGKPPLVESEGCLQDFPIDTPGSLLTKDLIEAIADEVIAGNARLLEMYATAGSCDTSYEVPGIARLRVNIYKQNAGRAIVMRKFPAEIPTLDKLGLPPVFREIVKEKNGIVLVTGATGSGKTTTLAAMMNHLNQTEPIHILTLEDPIEYLYPPGRAAVSQRELGRDFESFAHGLRVALRQAPKGILLGEIRDRETMEIAMTAAETGHIVFSTLHTINAGQTINRILGFFSRDEEDQVRIRLADILRYIVSQRLVSNTVGSRLLITEVIGNSLRTRESIRYGESEGKNFHEIIEAASTLGWHSFDQCLVKAFEKGQITEEIALLYCTNKGQMRRHLDLLQKKIGTAAAESVSGLKLDMVAPPKLAAAQAAAHQVPDPEMAPPVASKRPAA
jgi:twitching motility protein PilT